jgi:hypothetical protein
MTSDPQLSAVDSAFCMGALGSLKTCRWVKKYRWENEGKEEMDSDGSFTE